FFFQAEDGIRDKLVTGVQTCALPILIVGKVPFFEQYFAGGAETVRGYAEDRFWGKNTMFSNLEFRYPVQKAFSVVTFVDYGGARSEERRVGKECRCRWATYAVTKKRI